MHYAVVHCCGKIYSKSFTKIKLWTSLNANQNKPSKSKITKKLAVSEGDSTSSYESGFESLLTIKDITNTETFNFYYLKFCLFVIAHDK